jgi:hypothetical protein
MGKETLTLRPIGIFNFWECHGESLDYSLGPEATAPCGHLVFESLLDKALDPVAFVLNIDAD